MPSDEDSVESARATVTGKPRWRFAVASILLGGVFLVFGIGIYRYDWDNSATRIVSRIIPYPAAIVDGHVVRYSDFRENVRLLKSFYDDQKTSNVSTSVLPTEEEIKKRVLDRLVKDTLAERLAARYGIAVTSDDVEKAYGSMILDQSFLDGSASEKARAEAKAERTLKKLYGLSSPQFKSRILYPFLVRRELVKAIREDKELNTEKLKKAEEALAAVRDGMDFTEAVMRYSEDPNAANTGGDRGMLGRGLLPKEVEEVAFEMETGEVSDVIKSALGYHVIKVTDVKKKRGGAVVGVALQEILVRPISLDDYLEAQKRRVNIVVFVD